ncbi:MAG: divergent polysaccharide deacetylase family protein [Pseudomonadota bacterium]
MADTELKFRMVSALLIGALFAILGVLAASLWLTPSDEPDMQSLAEAPAPDGISVALNLSQVQRPKAPDAEIPFIQIQPLQRLESTIELSQYRTQPKVAIIIDDLGHSEGDSRRALTLPSQVAFALLPYTMHSQSLAQAAKAKGHELIVHMPMQPKDGQTDPGPHALKTSVSPVDLRQAIAWNLSQFDGFTAVNNHMGSRFTESASAMQILFEELSARGLSFYDSRTTASSQSVPMALAYDVRMAERDVFLDNEIEANAVHRQLEVLEQLARRFGSAIAIGHPHAVTFEQINAWAPDLAKRGIILVAPSTVLEERRSPLWRSRIRTAAASLPTPSR